MQPKSLILVEDQPATLKWLQQIILQAFPEAEQVTASTIEEATARMSQKTFDMGIIDMGLPDGSGLDLIPLIRRSNPDALVIVATIYDDDQHLLAALRQGANGYLLKDDPPEELLGYLQSVVAGRPAVSSRSLNQMLDHLNEEGLRDAEVSLTQREEEVLRVIAKGYNVAETAELFDLSVNTVKGYLKTIYAKLGVSSRAEATAEAIKRHLIHL